MTKNNITIYLVRLIEEGEGYLANRTFIVIIINFIINKNKYILYLISNKLEYTTIIRKERDPV